MANNEVTITCPICNAGHTTGGTATTIQHHYDLTKYQIPIEAMAITESPEGAKTLIFNCPAKQALFQAAVKRREKNGLIDAFDMEAISPTNSVLFDIGKQMISDSLKVSSSFCATMIPVCTGAIGVYTALFAIVLPKTCSFGITTGIVTLLPALAFIIAATGFAYGAFPRYQNVVLADPQSIETSRENIFRSRQVWVVASFALFCLAIVGAVIVVLWVAATHLS